MDESKIDWDAFRDANRLTSREIEVIKIIFTGVNSNKIIAEKMDIKPNTLDSFLSRIYLKTRISSKVGLLAECLKYRKDV